MDVAVRSGVYNWVVRKSSFSIVYTVASPQFFDNFYLRIPIYKRKDFEKLPLSTISDFFSQNIMTGWLESVVINTLYMINL